MIRYRFLPALLFVVAFTAAACSPRSDVPAREIGSDSLALAVLVDVGELDSTLMIDPRYATDNNFTGAPLPGYAGQQIFLRREVADPLLQAQAALAQQGLGLKLFDGYRPVRATLGMVDWTERVGRTDLLDDGYIARLSRHNLGVAIDLTVVTLDTGQELDMGTPYDTFDEAAHTANASGEVLGNRMLLKSVLENAGFENYQKEWWHYSFPVEGAVAFDWEIE